MNSKEKYLSHPLLTQLPVFFQPWWLDIVSSNWNVALAATGNELQAVWPYSVDKKWGFRLIRNPLLTPYLGPFFFHSVERQEEAVFFEQLWQQLPAWDSLDLETTTAFDNSSLFLQKGLNETPKVTYEIELNKTEQELFAAVHSNHRNLIRQAGQCHELVTGSSSLPRLLQLHKATFQRKEKPYPFDAGMIERLIAASTERDAGAILAARDADGLITACIFTVWDREKMYLLLSAVDPDKAHPGTVRLLIWNAIKAARQKGLSVFDFEGSMDPGIAAFFRRFGGTEKTYFCFTKHQSLLWQWKKALMG